MSESNKKKYESYEDNREAIVTATGKILTAAELDVMADELPSMEFDIDKIRPRGRPLLGDAPSKIVQVRLDPELAEKLSVRAEQDHTTSSDVLRQALTRYLAS